MSTLSSHVFWPISPSLLHHAELIRILKATSLPTSLLLMVSSYVQQGPLWASGVNCDYLGFRSKAKSYSTQYILNVNEFRSDCKLLEVWLSASSQMLASHKARVCGTCIILNSDRSGCPDNVSLPSTVLSSRALSASSARSPLANVGHMAVFITWHNQKEVRQGVVRYGLPVALRNIFWTAFAVCRVFRGEANHPIPLSDSANLPEDLFKLPPQPLLDLQASSKPFPLSPHKNAPLLCSRRNFSENSIRGIISCCPTPLHSLPCAQEALVGELLPNHPDLDSISDVIPVAESSGNELSESSRQPEFETPARVTLRYEFALSRARAILRGCDGSPGRERELERERGSEAAKSRAAARARTVLASVLADANRTWPKHVLMAFAQHPASSPQNTDILLEFPSPSADPRDSFRSALVRVLAAHCIGSDPELGYVQGLNLLASVLLLHCSEPVAYLLLATLLRLPTASAVPAESAPLELRSLLAVGFQTASPHLVCQTVAL
jgi:hypothetical protein